MLEIDTLLSDISPITELCFCQNNTWHATYDPEKRQPALPSYTYLTVTHTLFPALIHSYKTILYTENKVDEMGVLEGEEVIYVQIHRQTHTPPPHTGLGPVSTRQQNPWPLSFISLQKLCEADMRSLRHFDDWNTQTVY